MKHQTKLAGNVLCCQHSNEMYLHLRQRRQYHAGMESEQVTAPAATVLATCWNEAATAYENYFVQRFAPWNDRAVAALIEASQLCDGALLVPCCGPGWEVARVATARPRQVVIGIDFSHAMVTLTKKRCAALPNVSAECMDAARLHLRWERQAAGVLSCFGLQQLPNPVRSIESWFETLAPGGVLSVVYWPRESEATGPFAVLRELVAQRVAMPDPNWEGRLASRLSAAGAEILMDERLRHSIYHSNAKAVWRAFANSANLRALARKQGAGFINELGRAFCRRFPPGPIEHQPFAYLLVARRRL